MYINIFYVWKILFLAMQYNNVDNNNNTLWAVSCTPFWQILVNAQKLIIMKFNALNVFSASQQQMNLRREKGEKERERETCKKQISSKFTNQTTSEFPIYSKMVWGFNWDWIRYPTPSISSAFTMWIYTCALHNSFRFRHIQQQSVPCVICNIYILYIMSTRIMVRVHHIVAKTDADLL